jgi:c-di-GMP-binding flagellar brake protein YcgR
MTFNTGTGTTPLLARQTKGIYNFLIIPFIFICFFLIVWLLLRRLKKQHESPEWIEAQKKRLTTRKDVTDFSQKHSLTHTDSELLWEICRKNKAPNICYLIHDPDAIDTLFRTAFQEMQNNHEEEKKITELFRLRYRLELAEASTSVITSTTTIPEGTQLTYIAQNGTQILCTLKKNTQENMILSIPPQLYASESKPAPLAKAVFIFIAYTGMHYVFSTRVIRYSTGIDNQNEMVLAQTNDLHTQTKRQSKRIDMNTPCLFSAVKETDMLKKISFVPLEKQYECVLSNISADGCCIITPLPIKEKQNICVSIPLGGETFQTIGKIVATRRNPVNNTFFLHISFMQIEPRAQNKIFAFIYGYNIVPDYSGT